VQRIDHRVACDQDIRIGNSFAQQIPTRPFGRHKMQIGDYAGNAAVALFWKRLSLIVGAQAG
jgi:hypothetical protein